MNIYVDIDNTICNTEGSDYPNSSPRYDQIKKINKLFDEGNKITYWTARGIYNILKLCLSISSTGQRWTNRVCLIVYALNEYTGCLGRLGWYTSWIIAA